MKGWKTLLFGAIVAILGFLESVNWTDFIPEGNYQNILISFIGIAIIWLRSLTTTPMTKKE